MPSRALTVALAAGVLLVAVVAVDASMNRVYHLEAKLEGRWIRVVSSDMDWTRGGEPSLVAFDLNATDKVDFRVVAENGYPWALSEPVEVAAMNVALHSGTLEAPAFGHGETAFTLDASRILSQPAFGGGERPGERFWHPSFTLRVGDDVYYGGAAFREVAR